MSEANNLHPESVADAPMMREVRRRMCRGCIARIPKVLATSGREWHIEREAGPSAWAGFECTAVER